MCTAACYRAGDFYFGRNLDYERSYGEEVVLTPRSYPFDLRGMGTFRTRFAILGMAHVAGAYPLYYDGCNEMGLCIAGLNFVGNAVFPAPAGDGKDLTTFELIPWLLGQCGSLAEARTALQSIRLVNVPFSAQLPVSQLHWLIADRTGSAVLECTVDGMKIYDNPAGVLANNPPFPEQLAHLNCYRSLSAATAQQSSFAPGLDLPAFSRGMGAIGLPGDLSSPSRFVRAAFVAGNSRSEASEEAAVSQMFHILHAVEQQRGCCQLSDGSYEITIYTGVCNADRGIYYYTTYENPRITAVDMRRAGLDGETLRRWPVLQKPDILYQN